MDSFIFDLDGTLWDASETVGASWTEYLQKVEGWELTVTGEHIRSVFGRLMPEIAELTFVGVSKEEQLRLLDACCNAEHEALLKKCAPLYEDLEKTLKALSEKYPLFIVSNCQAGYIEVFLKASGLGKYFQGHLCPGDTGETKSANIRIIMDRFNLTSPVYVGDTMGDYNASKKAGVPFIFATYGYGNVPEPDAIINKPMDLLKINL